MTRYIIALTEQEEMSLRQLALTPGFDALLKLLQGESFDAQAKAMECEDPDQNKRLLLLSDAQCTKRVVSTLTQKLAAYRQIPAPDNTEEPYDPLVELFRSGGMN